MLIIAAFSSACLKFDYVLTLRPDGSGVMEFAYTISESSLSQFKAMMKLKDNLSALTDSPSDPFEASELNKIFLTSSEEQAKKELQRYESFGVKAENVKIKSVQGQRQAHFVLAFDNLAKLAQTEIFMEYGFNVGKDKNGDYVLSRPPERILAGDENVSTSFTQEEINNLSQFLAGFHVGIRIITPSKIITSSAQRNQSDNVAIWNFDFDSNPNALIALQNQKFEVTFDGSDKKVKIPPVKMHVGQTKASK